MRAVLDANVIVSGILSRAGAPARVLAAVDVGEVELIVSPLLLEELERTLGYPKLRKLISAADANRTIEWLGLVGRAVADPLTVAPVQSADPGDDYLVALAAAARAALVSGDQHLLALKGTIPVYRPREFLDLLESRRA